MTKYEAVMKRIKSVKPELLLEVLDVMREAADAGNKVCQNLLDEIIYTMWKEGAFR